MSEWGVELFPERRKPGLTTIILQHFQIID